MFLHRSLFLTVCNCTVSCAHNIVGPKSTRVTDGVIFFTFCAWQFLCQSTHLFIDQKKGRWMFKICFLASKTAEKTPGPVVNMLFLLLLLLDLDLQSVRCQEDVHLLKFVSHLLTPLNVTWHVILVDFNTTSSFFAEGHSWCTCQNPCLCASVLTNPHWCLCTRETHSPPPYLEGLLL